MFALDCFIFGFHIHAQFFSGLVLAVDLPMPSPQELGNIIKTELMQYLEILMTNLVPALAFSLVIRKLTS